MARKRYRTISNPILTAVPQRASNVSISPLFSIFHPALLVCRTCFCMQSRSLGFARMMDLKYALGDQLGGDEIEETPPYALWPRLLKQILGASLLVSRLGA